MSSMVFAYLFIFLLTGHAVYAWLLAKTDLKQLAAGPFQTAPKILGALLVVNGISLSAFVYPRAIWVLLHVAYQLILAIYEIWQTTKHRKRWPFILNHLGFAWILYLFYGATSSAFYDGDLG